MGTIGEGNRTPIVPIVLAAGDSTRMGFPKALLPIGKELFLTRILSIVEPLTALQPLVVVGRHAQRIEPVARGRAYIIVNSDPDQGQLSSIQRALSTVEPEALGALVWPVDQPAVSAQLVRDLIQLFLSSEPAIALPSYHGRRGHPALFHRSLFASLLSTPTHQGPKELVQQHRHRIAALPTEESAVVEDIDTPEDYKQLTGEDLATALRRIANRNL